ncbi:rhomboid-like protein [Actinacidiphila acididurans]|uniref:Rhomboid family intramembrane serine protease n=1 Tax=Actinacidiphila acididurans TaxID=2784346 RepID=A0ABS2TRR3_9ACTN|nr:rhomboid-like protein [Actinacidiphila acididurans]MBM9506014.1 hypothetical protein [Actinacidiphila acididurans]
MASQMPETSDPPHDRALPPSFRRHRRAGAAMRHKAAGWLRSRRRPPLASWARKWVGSSPGTHLWLVILAVTSMIVAASPPHVRSYLLHGVSTNLVELGRHPIRVLVASALWIESPSGFAFYAVLFELIHAPVERWLGTWRWLAVVALAHVGATLVSEKAVLLGIRDQRLPHSLAHTIDIGVSYGLAGVVGVLAYQVPRPWRWGYAAGIVAFFAWPLLHDGTFTDLGHLSAALIGLGCWVLTPPARTADPDPRGRRDRRDLPGSLTR